MTAESHEDVLKIAANKNPLYPMPWLWLSSRPLVHGSNLFPLVLHLGNSGKLLRATIVQPTPFSVFIGGQVLYYT